MRIQRSEAGGPLVAAVTGDDRRCGTTGEARAEQTRRGRRGDAGDRRREWNYGYEGRRAPRGLRLICGSPRADPTVGESCIQSNGREGARLVGRATLVPKAGLL